MLDTVTNPVTVRPDGLPSEMRRLLDAYPRDNLGAHPGFREKTRQWLGAHRMFLHMAQRIRLDAEGYLDVTLAPKDYAERLSHVGGRIVGNLHGHHGWEDHSYFLELSAADLDQVLDGFTSTANRAIKLIQLDGTQARDEIGRLHGTAQTNEAFLARRQTDEEELAVPIILSTVCGDEETAMIKASDDAAVQEDQSDAAARRARGEFVRGVNGSGIRSVITIFRRNSDATIFSWR